MLHAPGPLLLLPNIWAWLSISAILPVFETRGERRTRVVRRSICRTQQVSAETSRREKEENKKKKEKVKSQFTGRLLIWFLLLLLLVHSLPSSFFKITPDKHFLLFLSLSSFCVPFLVCCVMCALSSPRSLLLLLLLCLFFLHLQSAVHRKLN